MKIPTLTFSESRSAEESGLNERGKRETAEVGSLKERKVNEHVPAFSRRWSKCIGSGCMQACASIDDKSFPSRSSSELRAARDGR